MVSTNAKLTALADHLKAALVAEEFGVNVETRYRRASETGRNRGDQRELFGDPVYYLEVLPASMDAIERDPSGAYNRRTHDFQVVFMLEYEDGADRNSASQSSFNRLMDTLYAAAEDGHLNTDDGPQQMQPGEAQHQFTSLDSRGEAIVHELTFDVTLTDQHQ